MIALAWLAGYLLVVLPFCWWAGWKLKRYWS